MNKPRYEMIYSQYECPNDLPLIPFSQDTWFISNKTVSFLHCHNCFEITYWAEGEGYFQIENEEHPVRAGDVCILCQNSMHLSFVRSDAIARCQYLYVDLERFAEMFPVKLEGLDYLKYHTPQIVNVIRREDCPEIGHTLREIFRELEEKPFNYRMTALSLTNVLLTLILRRQNFSNDGYPEPYEGKFVIAASLDYINESYAEEITTEQLAQVCHMSVTNYRRTFKKVMRLSPMTYLKRVRVEKACARLFETNLSVLEISQQVGYQSICSFNRDFRLFIDASPLQWRRSTRLSRRV